MSYHLMIKPDSTLQPQGAVEVTKDTPINEGDFVKIGVSFNKGSEIFWALVYAIDRDNDTYAVRINQDLQLTGWHGLSDGNELVVKRENISYVL